MPIITPALTTVRGLTSGVMYRDTSGRWFSATIIGPGSSSGAKLRIGSRSSTGKNLDNIALGTTLHQTNRYFWRITKR